MNQKILGTLLILGALYGGYELFSQYAAAERHEKNPWVLRMTPLIKMHTAKQIQSGKESASDASFITLLYLAWQAEESGYNEMETIKRAATAAGALPSEAVRIATAVHENVMFAKSWDVFSDASNAVRMERGETPVMQAKGWEDEPLVVGHQLSPLLAPEAAFAIPNLRLMPESVREMSSDRVSNALVDLARRWATDKIIFPESYDTISKMAKERAAQ